MCNRCHSTLDNRALQCALREAEAAAARACECARAAETAGCRAAEMARAAEQAACRAENAASAAHSAAECAEVALEKVRCLIEDASQTGCNSLSTDFGRSSCGCRG